MATVIRNATVLTLDESDRLHQRADVVIEGGLIRAVGLGAAESAPPDAQVIAGEGKLLIPGLINGHFHSPGNFMKGALENWPLDDGPRGKPALRLCPHHAGHHRDAEAGGDGGP